MSTDGHEHGLADIDIIGTRNARSGTAVRDPVCGMDVDPHTTAHRATYDGRTYYFCSTGCREKFLAAPANFLARAGQVAKPVPEGTIYTCPMHPEIRQTGPGACPSV